MRSHGKNFKVDFINHIISYTVGYGDNIDPHWEDKTYKYTPQELEKLRYLPDEWEGKGEHFVDMRVDDALYRNHEDITADDLFVIAVIQELDNVYGLRNPLSAPLKRAYEKTAFNTAVRKDAVADAKTIVNLFRSAYSTPTTRVRGSWVIKSDTEDRWYKGSRSDTANPEFAKVFVFYDTAEKALEQRGYGYSIVEN